ncbi:PaaI family thioesterase [Vibrio mexicanus]|uniref:PaaI family thioesterase n=1 Tax=Vibrio mexicanus TaxID=1004326 RepID=UPI00063CEDC5|nr:PaaI family thioesterase [Vibrio mexicanus]
MISKSDLEQFFHDEFAQADFSILSVSEEQVIIKRIILEQHTRPGNTVSGPVLMEVADSALYVAVLYQSHLATMAVTSNLNINFLKKPGASQNIIAECRVLKLGRKNAYGEVMIYSELSRDLVAHATGTYVIPK